ncbi:hypothetical protein QWY31_01760 [Cytophagales bacterium LB-30]|uniref:Uncharacterized protein n=1 Tax=Shiella aurantiaca TaxID=3058365 RepID=A0ABT8F1N1_9BACT|nr:hypothetical protein [Shiella aurantiaca]MDN4164204.1 hypothetical protein [Shiella aurantiaca]
MKTQQYNPSPLEVQFAEALENLRSQIEPHLGGNKIVEIVNKLQADNPIMVFHLQDADGDPHEMVIKLIQRPDKFD